MGYSTISKAYKVYHPQIEKITITRDVHFNEDEQWDQKNLQIKGESSQVPEDNFPKVQTTSQWQNELEDDSPVRGTKSISDIYQRWNVAIGDPASHEKALKDSRWRNTMKEEMTMIQKDKTQELVERPTNRKVIRVKWVFRTKLNANSFDKYKAGLIVKGYTQIFGVDYSDKFAPVVRLDTIRLLLAIVAQIIVSNSSSKAVKSVSVRCQTNFFK